MQPWAWLHNGNDVKKPDNVSDGNRLPRIPEYSTDIVTAARTVAVFSRRRF